ncbi:signal transduction histidine kinase [Microbacterium sp. AG790]|nr:signal transduction histidine kinase [Microbacterium sp. AG790]
MIARQPQALAASGTNAADLRLPSTPGIFRRYRSRHPRLMDILLVLAIVDIAGNWALGIAASEIPQGASILLTALLAATTATGVLFRRTRPLTALSVMAAGAVVVSIWPPNQFVLLPAAFAVYSLAVYKSVRSGWAAAAIVGASAVTAALIREAGQTTVGSFNPLLNPSPDAPTPLWVSVLSFSAQIGVVLAVSLALGITIGDRRRYLAALIERARELAVERDRQGELAAAAERNRIATEMHDIVSHSLTMMIALAEGCAAKADRASPEAADAMRKVASTGRAAMVDMRRMLGVLGGDPAETVPQPNLADLPQLIERFRNLGVPITLRIDGHPPGDPTLQLTIYRIVQEALTNATRYAHGPTEVAVRIALDATTLTTTIIDDGLPGFPYRSAGTGRGLLGIRERVAALSGTVDAGPRKDNLGWQVKATLPRGDAKEGWT